MNNPGHLFIVSAPSGAGKTTLCKALSEHFPDMQFSISYTSRPPRGEEKNGDDYYFVTKEEFIQGIERGEWAEWAEVHENFYATSAEFLDRTLASGRDILLDIDVQGTRQMLRRYPDSITVFVMPPSFDVLRARLESRGTDDRDIVEKRMTNAEKEIAERHFYRHVIINDRLPRAAAELISIVKKYRDNA